MTREEAIKKLESLKISLPAAKDEISEIIELLKSPWISVKDRLSTKGGHYLCMDDNHNIAVLAFVGDKWINTKTFTDVPLEVVKFWMPIPELPKE